MQILTLKDSYILNKDCSATNMDEDTLENVDLVRAVCVGPCRASEGEPCAFAVQHTRTIFAFRWIKRKWIRITKSDRRSRCTTCTMKRTILY